MKVQENEKHLQNLSVLQMMENGQIDVFGHPESISFGLNQSAIEATKTSYISSYQVAQFLKADASEDFSDFSSFLFKNHKILFIALFGYLSVVLASLICPQILSPNYDRPKSLRLVLFHIFFLDHSQLPRVSMKLALIFLGTNLFFWFDLLFLSGSIKTEKVVSLARYGVENFAKSIKNVKKLVLQVVSTK